MHDVREQDGSDAGISCISSSARQYNCSQVICFRAAEEYFCNVGLYLDDLLSQQPVRFTMDAGCCLCARRMGEAKNFAATLVNPVFMVLDAILSLRFDIFRVTLRDIFRGSSLRKVVDVHV